MKNPNGYGSILKLGGKRRKPFAVRVTAGWELNKNSGKIKQKYKYIGYYKTRPEAMIALAEYNKSPYDIDAKKVTFEEIYAQWAKDKFKDKPVTRGYKSAFNLSESLHKMTFIDIRKIHMQTIIDTMDKSHSTKSITKTLYSQLYKFALENDIIDKNYSEFVILNENSPKTSKKPFSNVEINKLWDCVEKQENVDIALILIYTGMRPGEIIEIENENINLKERYMVGGIKTESGKDRIIPLNKKILPLIEKRMDENNKYLMATNAGKKMSYNTLRMQRWNPLMSELKMEHTLHECRHTFATLMDNANANKLSIKRIMGHSIRDITDNIYTHKNIDELIKAIDLI